MANNSFTRSGIRTNTLGLPVQSVDYSVKLTEEWQQQNMDFFESQATYQNVDKLHDLKKYRIVNGQLDIRDYQYAMDPLSLGMNKDDLYGSTEEITHYPIISRPINTIVGERIKRPVNFFVTSESAGSRNEYFRVKTDLLRSHVIQKIQNNVYNTLIAQGIQPDAEDFQNQVQAKTPEEIQDYMVKDYTDITEQVCSRILKNYWKKQSLENEFIDGFKRAVIVAKEFYHTYCIGGKNVYTENITDQEIFYHKSPSVKWVAEGQYAGFVRWLTSSTIIDRYGKGLKPKDIKNLEENSSPAYHVGPDRRTGINSIDYNTSTYKNFTGETYDNFGNQFTYEGMLSDFYHNGGTSTSYMQNYGMNKVVKAYWKSLRKIGFLTYYDEDDIEQKTIVDGSYKVQTHLGEHVEWEYINEIWEGVKINDNIYTDVRRCPYQIFNPDQPEYCPLPIEGCTYNDTSSKPTSFVDLMMPWQELYNITAYELKKDLTSGLGHVMFMSIDHIPNIPGFSKEKWYYWAKEMKIAWVQQNKNSNYNQFSAQDMSFANDIIAKMNLLDNIQQKCDAMGGFTEGRLGNASQEGTASQATQSLVTSVNQTEYIFFKHFQLIQRVLNYALNISKQTISNSDTLRNLFNDMEQQYLDDAIIEQLPFAQVGVYISNSGEDLRKKEGLNTLLQAAAQNGADLVDMADILLSDTVSETRNILAKIRNKTNEQRQQEQQLKQQELDNQLQIAREAEEKEDARNEAKLRSNEEVAYIRTFGGRNASPTDDTNGDSVPDALQFEEFNLKAQDQAQRVEAEDKKTRLAEKKLLMDAALKKRDQDIALKNQENDLQIAKQNKIGRTKSK